MADFIHILARLDARSRQWPGLVAGRHRAVRVHSSTGFTFDAIMRGGLWLVPDGDGPVELGEGNCFPQAGASDAQPV